VSWSSEKADQRYRYSSAEGQIVSPYGLLNSYVSASCKGGAIRPELKFALHILVCTPWTIEVLGFDSRRGLGIFLLIAASRMALGPTHRPIQWLSGALSLGVKRRGREADHSAASCAEVKE